MNWPRSGTCAVDPPNQDSTARAVLVDCRGVSLFGLGPSHGRNRA